MTIFCAPLYLVRMSLFGIPTNIFELMAMLSIMLTVRKDKGLFFKKISALPTQLKTSCLLIIIGTLLSIFLNGNHLVGLGILKSWFLIPMLFSFSLYASLKSTVELGSVFKSVFFSAASVGFVSLGYRFFGLVTYDNRLSAFFLSPNHLAMYLSAGVFFGIYFLIKDFLSSAFSKKTSLNISLLLLMLIPIYFTYSYGAWLAVLASATLATLLLVPAKKYLLILLSSLLFVFCLLFYLQLGSEKFSAISDSSIRSSLASRQMIWQSAFAMIKEKPFFGIGPGNFQAEYLALQPRFAPYLEWAVPQPHNLFLAFWLQSGLLGFFGFLLLLHYIFCAIRQEFKHKKNALMLASLFGFVVYTLLHGLVDTTYWKNDLSLLFWLCAFLVLFLQKHHSKENQS